MDFQMLDRFFHMNDLEVSTDYHFIVSKPIFRGGDYDQRLILILDSINSKEKTFSDLELTIVSTIVKLRKSKSYVEFINVYPILKEVLFQPSDRENNLSIIKALLINKSNISSSFDFDGSINISDSPGIKNVRSNVSLSPSCNDLTESEEGSLSTSFKVEVIFGWRSDFDGETNTQPDKFSSNTQCCVTDLMKCDGIGY